MSSNPVIWFEIYVQDMPRAKAFYEQVLGTKLEKLGSPDMDMWSFPSDMNKPGCTGALVKMSGVPSGGSTLVYFHSEDCAIEEARIQKAGGKIQRPKMSIGQYGFVAMAYDPDGNLFGLHSMP